MFEHMALQFSGNGVFTSLSSKSSPSDYLPNQFQFTAEQSSLMDHNEVYSIPPSTSLVHHQEPPQSIAFTSIIPPSSPLFFGTTYNNMPNSDDALNNNDESTMLLGYPSRSLAAVGKSPSSAVYTSRSIDWNMSLIAIFIKLFWSFFGVQKIYEPFQSRYV